jgi:hypothetical protein
VEEDARHGQKNLTPTQIQSTRLCDLLGIQLPTPTAPPSALSLPRTVTFTINGTRQSYCLIILSSRATLVDRSFLVINCININRIIHSLNFYAFWITSYGL